MARRPKLEIDDVVYKNVYKVEYEIYTSKDETGRPSNRPRSGTIKITRESDDNTNVAVWASDSAETSWKNGKVSFFTPAKKEMKVLTWEAGFISKYVETIPHTKENSDEQIYEYFEISCKKLTVGEAEVDNRWDEDWSEA